MLWFTGPHLWFLGHNTSRPLPAISPPPQVGFQVRTTANAAGGATSLTVSPLAASIPTGTVMSFGSVTVTTSDYAAAGSTSLPVYATSGAIASGTVAAVIGSNVVYVRRVSLTMPAPTVVNGRPSGDWLPT